MFKSITSPVPVASVSCASGCGLDKRRLAEGFAERMARENKLDVGAGDALKVMEVRLDEGPGSALAVAAGADDIALYLPDVVALQAPGASIEVLLRSLAERGHAYEIAAISSEDGITIPEAILVRKPAGPGDRAIVILLADAGVYDASVAPATGEEIRRGWVAIDAEIDGVPFRLVCTHLEPDASDVRLAQAAELLAGPASSEAVHLVGDFETDPPAVEPEPLGAGD